MSKTPLLLSSAVLVGFLSLQGLGGTDTLVFRPPLRQSRLSETASRKGEPLSLRDAARGDRWIGVGVREVRWALDGSGVYFRWNRDPKPDDDPGGDPWFWVNRIGDLVRQVPLEEVPLIPPPDPSWSGDKRRATWVMFGRLYLFDAGRSGDQQVRPVLALERPARSAVMSPDGQAIQFTVGEDLFRYEIDSGRLRQITRKHVIADTSQTPTEKYLAERQMETFEQLRRERQRRDADEARRLALWPEPCQPLPVPSGFTLSNVRLSPDGNFVILTARRESARNPGPRVLDYLTESGTPRVLEAGARVGEPELETRLGIVRFDPRVPARQVQVRWLEFEPARERKPLYFPPAWSPDGKRAVIQVISADHKDQWIAELEVAKGTARVLAHDRDDAFLGGPPIQCDRFHPSLLDWLPDGTLVFASERSGWSHLHALGGNGTARALTSGAWEVRGAGLSRDRSTWLLQASREHPCEDHLYLMPAQGGPLIRLTKSAGRNWGLLSPDGGRLAVVTSDAAHLPDLFLQDAKPDAEPRRITVSGTDALVLRPLVRPAVVTFRHPDGGPVWAAMYQPVHPNPERAAVIHVHGGGDRQFSHRGWSVYGYADHLGLIHYLAQQGYTVLDLDYRGSAGFGRDYRTDIYRSAGQKDSESALAAVDFLVKEQGIDRTRIGIYGLSYGGYLTLVALARYPGVFAAGVANAAVADMAQTTHGWTVRVMGLPYQNPEAYRNSSPIGSLASLQDPLLIVHGLRDDNVPFQHAVLLVQRLIELEKPFEVMFYPAEGHMLDTEKSRSDYVRRVTAFFDRHLLRHGETSARKASEPQPLR